MLLAERRRACMPASMPRMAQITVRMPEPLVAEVRAAAASRALSVNSFVTSVLRAVVDPGNAEPGIARLRERLARAGLLAEPAAGTPGRPRPDPAAVADARVRAGGGTALSDIVVAERG